MTTYTRASTAYQSAIGEYMVDVPAGYTRPLTAMRRSSPPGNPRREEHKNAASGVA